MNRSPWFEVEDGEGGTLDVVLRSEYEKLLEALEALAAPEPSYPDYRHLPNYGVAFLEDWDAWNERRVKALRLVRPKGADSAGVCEEER
jgi:hypothetical protein